MPTEKLRRREFCKIVLAAAGAVTFGGADVASAQPQAPSTPSRQTAKPRLSLDTPAHPTDEDLQFFKQIGLDCVDVAETPDDLSVESLRAIVKRYGDAGLAVTHIDNLALANGLEAIVLNKAGRDDAIEVYKSWIRTAGKAGLPAIKPIQYNVTQALSSGMAETRGTRDRDFDLNSSELAGPPARIHGKGTATTLFFGRAYSRDEIWENYTYFVKQIVPVAEEAGIQIGFHPDEPPTPSLFGVPRIFSSFDDYKKALAIANSPNVGVCLATGQWLAGGAGMGIDPAGAIRYFAPRGQLFEVLFRNISSPLPHFHQTFVDDGYYDMFKITKALVDVKFDSNLTLDHYIPMVGGMRASYAFGVGYMRATLQAAQRGYHA